MKSGIMAKSNGHQPQQCRISIIGSVSAAKSSVSKAWRRNQK